MSSNTAAFQDISGDAEGPAHEGASPSTSRSTPGLLGFFSVDRVFLASLCLASVGFFAVAFSISLKDPEYFSRQAISSLSKTEIDPIMTGAIVETSAMPVPRIVRSKPPVAADYQIVMVFDREAILATEEELWRVKVGSQVPGLGEVLEIDATAGGGVVKASQATLRTVPR